MSTTIEDRCSIGAAPGRDPFGDAIGSIRDALAAVADLPAWTLTEDTVQQHLAAMLRVRAAVEELTARSPPQWSPATSPAWPERRRHGPG